MSVTDYERAIVEKMTVDGQKVLRVRTFDGPAILNEDNQVLPCWNAYSDAQQHQLIKHGGRVRTPASGGGRCREPAAVLIEAPADEVGGPGLDSIATAAGRCTWRCSTRDTRREGRPQTQEHRPLSELRRAGQPVPGVPYRPPGGGHDRHGRHQRRHAAPDVPNVLALVDAPDRVAGDHPRVRGPRPGTSTTGRGDANRKRSDDVSGIEVEANTGRVLRYGKHVGTLHYPYEFQGQRVKRKGWLLIMAGKRIGSYKTKAQAVAAAEAWEPDPANVVGRSILGEEMT
jgi:hypothetical protein